MILIITLTFIFLLPFNVLAQTASPSAIPTESEPSPTVSEEQKNIDTLKEKIATKVEELRKENDRAIGASIKSIDTNKKTLKVVNDEQEEFEIKIDAELTKFYQISGTTAKEISFNSLKKDSYVIVTGILNDKTVDANSVFVDEHFIVNEGKVVEVNTEDFFLKVLTNDKETYTLDIETFTKQQIVNIKTLVLERIGFSKIKEGDTIHFVVKKTGLEQESNRFAAQKFLIIPQEFFLK